MLKIFGSPKPETSHSAKLRGAEPLKYGYCKYADKCRFRHNNVICVKKNCSVFDCEMRHPVVCKHFLNFKKCKFTDCAYKHSKGSDTDDMAMKIKNGEDKITEVKNLNNVRDIEEK